MPADALEPPASAYDMGHADTAEQRATFAVIVDNEPGVLHRVVGLFAGRGYNIESLTVAETDKSAHTSRITIVTTGTAPEVPLNRSAPSWTRRSASRRCRT